MPNQGLVEAPIRTRLNQDLLYRELYPDSGLVERDPEPARIVPLDPRHLRATGLRNAARESLDKTRLKTAVEQLEEAVSLARTPPEPGSEPLPDDLMSNLLEMLAYLYFLNRRPKRSFETVRQLTPLKRDYHPLPFETLLDIEGNERTGLIAENSRWLAENLDGELESVATLLIFGGRFHRILVDCPWYFPIDQVEELETWTRRLLKSRWANTCLFLGHHRGLKHRQPETARLLPMELAYRHEVTPIDRDNGVLTLGCFDCPHSRLKEFLLGALTSQRVGGLRLVPMQRAAIVERNERVYAFVEP